MRTICENCKNWKEIKPEIRHGWCSFRQIVIEWCCGIIWQTKTRVKVCPEFSKK